MPLDEYWMGKNLNLEEVWEAYDSGAGYMEKAQSVPLHLLRLGFAGHPLHLPLFDHEAIFKTVKGTFHDVKQECLTPAAYDAAPPIFLYRVDRGSGVFEFLGQFDPLVTWIVALGAAANWHRKSLAADQDLDEKKLNFLRSSFPNASRHDVQAYMKAWTTFGRRRVLHRLLGQNLQSVEMSSRPLSPPRPTPVVNMEPIVGPLEHGIDEN